MLQPNYDRPTHIIITEPISFEHRSFGGKTVNVKERKKVFRCSDSRPKRKERKNSSNTDDDDDGVLL